MKKPVAMIPNYKIVDDTTLKALNDIAIQRNFNRSWHWEEIKKEIKPNTFFQVQSLMLYPYEFIDAVRCEVLLTERGETGILDIPVNLFNKLTDLREGKE